MGTAGVRRGYVGNAGNCVCNYLCLMSYIVLRVLIFNCENKELKKKRKFSINYEVLYLVISKIINNFVYLRQFLGLFDTFLFLVS